MPGMLRKQVGRCRLTPTQYSRFLGELVNSTEANGFFMLNRVLPCMREHKFGPVALSYKWFEQRQSLN